MKFIFIIFTLLFSYCLHSQADSTKLNKYKLRHENDLNKIDSALYFIDKLNDKVIDEYMMRNSPIRERISSILYEKLLKIIEINNLFYYNLKSEFSDCEFLFENEKNDCISSQNYLDENLSFIRKDAIELRKKFISNYQLFLKQYHDCKK